MQAFARMTSRYVRDAADGLTSREPDGSPGNVKRKPL